MRNKGTFIFSLLFFMHCPCITVSHQRLKPILKIGCPGTIGWSTATKNSVKNNQASLQWPNCLHAINTFNTQDISHEKRTRIHCFLGSCISNGYFFTPIKGCPIISSYQYSHCLQLHHKIRQFFRCQTSVGIVSRFVDAIHCRMPVPPDVVSRLVSLAWLTSNGKSHQCTEQPKYKLKSIAINQVMLIIFFSAARLENLFLNSMIDVL